MMMMMSALYCTVLSRTKFPMLDMVRLKFLTTDSLLVFLSSMKNKITEQNRFSSPNAELGTATATA